MYIVIFCSLLALLFTYLESLGKFKKGMKLGFVLITILAVIHYDYGNDYIAYFNGFKQIVLYDFNWNSIIDGVVYREPGWAILCYLFKPFGQYGFFLLVAVISIFQNVVFYITIRNNVPKPWWAFAIFIYLFTESFYLYNFSMLRQGLIVAVFLSLWGLIRERRWIIPCVVMFLSSFVHSSALFFIPFVFWGFVPIKNGKYWVLLYIILFITLHLSKDLLNNAFASLVATAEEFQTYSDYYEGKNSTQYSLGLGFLASIIPIVASLYYISDKRYASSTKQLVAISSLGALIVPFTQIIPLIARIGIYFSVYSIVAIPIVYSTIRNKSVQIFAVSIYAIITLYTYIKFFSNPVWEDAYSEFNTIFSVIL